MHGSWIMRKRSLDEADGRDCPRSLSTRTQSVVSEVTRSGLDLVRLSPYQSHREWYPSVEERRLQDLYPRRLKEAVDVKGAIASEKGNDSVTVSLAYTPMDPLQPKEECRKVSDHEIEQPSASSDNNATVTSWGKKKKRSSVGQPKKRLYDDLRLSIGDKPINNPDDLRLVWLSRRKRVPRRSKANPLRIQSICKFLQQEIIVHEDHEDAFERQPSVEAVTNIRGKSSDGAEFVRQRARTPTTSADNDSDSEYEVERQMVQRKHPSILPVGEIAISKSGYTCRGRVKQKAQKRVELVRIGTLRLAKGWYNAGYIFPVGYKSKTMFRSSINLNVLCPHECEIVEGVYWPAPTFVIVAKDRPSEPLVSKSCTGCWSLVLQRINQEITRRRRLGESLPPPPKTAIAGPEYFGLNQNDILRKIESLDNEKKCEVYWKGKVQLKLAIHCADQKARSAVGGSKSTRHRVYISDSDEEDQNGDEEGVEHASNAWSTISRLDRYRRRCRDRGGESEVEQDDSPLPEFIDPITMHPVVTPAISPYGHVVGLATWRACLGDQRVCPFTRKPLTVEQCTVLTKHNIERYRDKIIHP